MNKIYLNNVCFRLAQNYNNPITYAIPKWVLLRKSNRIGLYIFLLRIVY